MSGIINLGNYAQSGVNNVNKFNVKNASNSDVFNVNTTSSITTISGSVSITNSSANATINYTSGVVSGEWLLNSTLDAFSSSKVIIPSVSGTINFGSTTNRWNIGYFNSLDLITPITSSSVNASVSDSGNQPVLMTLSNLGVGAGTGLVIQLIGSDATLSVTNIDIEYDGVNLNIVNSDTTGIITVNNSINPASNLTYNLGNNAISRRWNNVFAGAFVNTSDIRLKEDIHDMSDQFGLSFINQLQPKTYRMKTSDQNNKKRFGLIAQDVESILQKMNLPIHDYFILDNDNPDSYGLCYHEFTTIMIKAMQEMSVKIDYLEKQLIDSKTKH
jgi:hypothetical protein